MAQSDVAICNVALSYVGVEREISSLDNPKSKEASLCKLHYDNARKEVLQEPGVNWSFAKRVVTLGLVEEDPTLEWAYSYRYPGSALKARRLISLIRPDPNPPPFVLGADDQGRLLYCDESEPQLEYTKDETDTTKFSASFDDALAWKIGEKIAPALSRLKGAVDRCERKYMIALSIAAALDATEEQVDDPPESEFITGRR